MSAVQTSGDGIGLEADPVYGAVVANFPSDRTRLILIAGTISVVSAVILNFTTAAIPGWIGPAITIVLMAAIVLALAWYALHLWNREVILYERGFSLREGSDIVFFHYDEVRGVRLRAERQAYFFGLLRRQVYATTIISIRGETFTLDNVYRRAAVFGDQFLRLAGPTIRSAIDRGLAQGAQVEFGGGLTVSSAGLHREGADLAWAEGGMPRAANRMLHLTRADGTAWAAIPLRELENLPLLLDLLRERAVTSAGHVNQQTGT